ncbi:MAG: urea ABC transporter ATP-binding subunit UrtE [Pseudomonadota bacterium]
MLEVSGVNQYYGESHTLWDVALSVPAGSCTVLMGRNGVGKTTLLKAVMGLLPIKSGSLLFEGDDLRGKPAELRARLGIAYVPQGRDIFPQLTVEENLLTARASGRVVGKQISPHIYELFPVLAQMRQRRGGDLSGGQQQQLAIGRALLIKPKLLILDEPCEGIQPNIVHQIGDVIMHLRKDYGLTVLLVEQKLPFARRVGQDFCLMDKGRTVASGLINQLDQALIAEHLAV